MSAEMDFKALWNKEAAKDRPDINVLLKKAGGLRKAVRIRVLAQSAVLLSSVAILVFRGVKMEHRQLTTTIGFVMMVVAMVSYVIASNQLLPMLFKSNVGASSQEYLRQLIRIKRKLEFLDKVMVNIYFSLLFVGLFLGTLQFTTNISIAWAALYYVITFGLMTGCWVYSRRTWIRKKQKSLTDVIEKLEAVNGQLSDSD